MRGARQVTAHRHALCIGCLHPVRLGRQRLGVIPTAEKPNLQMRAGGGECLLALKRREDRRTGVFFGPNAGQTCRPEIGGIGEFADIEGQRRMLNRGREPTPPEAPSGAARTKAG